MSQRQKNDQIPLGELLLNARLSRNLSRAEVAAETGISENSIVRYEKAGVESGGQYPSGPKLASLCFFLGLSPLKVLLGCLDREDYWRAYGDMQDDWLIDHPATTYLSHQFYAVTSDNHLLREALKVFLEPEKAREHYDEETIEWIRDNALKVIRAQESFEKGMKDKGLYCEVSRATVTPGQPEKSKTLKEGEDPYDYSRMQHDYLQNRNGSE